MTNPTINAISSEERDLLEAYKVLESKLDKEGIAVLKAYARAYSTYRIARVASVAWEANKFSVARDLLTLIDEDNRR